MSDSKLKSIENTENLCPISRKRVKNLKNETDHIAHWKTAKTEFESKSASFQEMGIGMLESDESSSSASTVALAINTNSSADENSNEATPNLDAPKFRHSLIHQQRLNYSADLLDVTSDNANFIDPNESLKPSSVLSVSSSLASSYFASYNSNKSSISTNTEKLPQKKIAILGAGAGISSTSNTLACNNKNRSPLANVACNYNYKNVSHVQQSVASGCSSSSGSSNNYSSQRIPYTNTGGNSSNNTVIAPHCSKNSCTSSSNNSNVKQYFVPDESFFIYRNQALRRQTTDGRDYFKTVSDEMILQIFKWLPKKTLIRCSYVCQRFNRCARDESLWTRLDLGGRSLKSGALGYILPRGVVILRLAQSEMNHPIFDPEWLQIYPDYQTKLQYLDISMSSISKPSLKMLISRCRQLKKISLEHVNVNDEICDEIAKNTQLEALNLAMCTGLEAWSVRKILIALQNLNSLNISWTNLTIDAVSALVTNVTPNIMRLNMSGCRKTMFDSHLATLSKRCTQLLELDLSDCTGLTSSAIPIVCQFKMLEYLSLSRCYLISASSYIELKLLPTLRYLDVFGLLSDSALETLEKNFPALGINKFIHSSVARPTVGTRRTSIWGLRTRD